MVVPCYVVCRIDETDAQRLRYLCGEGKLKDAMEFLQEMDEQDIMPSMEIYECLLRACSKLKAIALAKQLHGHIMRKGLESNKFLGNSCVLMYVKCESFRDALQVFNRLPQRLVSSWNALISACIKDEKNEEALEMYHMMPQEGAKPNKYTFASVLKACGSLGLLQTGRQIHTESIKQRCELDYFVGTAVVDMYVKCGSMISANDVFDRLPQRDMVTWNTMIAGYTQHHQGEKALQLYARMQEEGAIPNNWVFVSALKACSSCADAEEALPIGGRSMKVQSLRKCQAVHADIRRLGYTTDLFIGNTLVSAYAKCGSLLDARHVFDTLAERDLVSWSAIFAAYAEQEMGEETLDLYAMMQEEGVKPDDRIFVSVLKGCGSLAAAERRVHVEGQSVKVDYLGKVREIHAQVLEEGYESDVFVGNTLVYTYAKCGSILHAKEVFDKLSKRDVVSWNALLAGYAEQDEGELALQLYDEVRLAGITPDTQTYVSALKACVSVATMEETTVIDGRPIKSRALLKGQDIFREAVDSGYGSHTMVCNTLMHLYCKCGSVEDAQLVFDTNFQHDVVSWNVMISGYAEHKQGDRAFQLFEQMQGAGMLPDARTFVSMLKACCSLAVVEEEKLMYGEVLKPDSLKMGKLIHREIHRRGLAADVFVNNCLIHMYSKCGSISDAQNVFNGHPQRDAVAWNAMIVAYTEQEQENKAMSLYVQMRREGVLPTEATFLCVLKACGNVGALKMCIDIHQDVVEHGVEDSVIVASSLIHSYGKCGRMDKAHQLFNKLAKQDVVSWNGLVAGHARQGDYEMSLQCLQEMQDAGVQPDEVTFICLLTACSHAGMLSEGLHYFKNLSAGHGLTASTQHYSCIVDLLGRAGFLEQAQRLMAAMPTQPDLPMWLSLLGACRKHGEVELGKRAFDSAVDLDPKHTAPYILMSNIYARAGMVLEANDIERLRRGASSRKKPGQSWIEFGKDVEVFVAGDKLSPHSNLVSAKVRELNQQIRGQVISHS